ncbi:MAG: hypothetical protein MJ002_03395 [Paludibacteraceae bacterium]|nr:hypothetical protein [Paludibacteraceae bacterium]
MCEKAATWIRSFGGQQELDFDDRKGKEVEDTKRFLSNIDSVLINGTQLLLNQVYDSIGFNQIPDEILRHLVIARVSQPRSKLATVDYLKSYYDEDVDLNHIYLRPMFHFTERRIEAHVCICFIAYKVYKELERPIAVNKIGMSVDKALDAARTITTIRVKLPENGSFITKTLFLTEKHHVIKPLFDLSDGES